MTPRVNLLHEQLQQRLERQTDPIKIGMLGLLLVATALTMQFMWKGAEARRVKSYFDTLQSTLKVKKEQSEKALAQEALFHKQIDGAAALLQRAENRFLWAPFLEVVLKSVPRDIQILGLAGRVDRQAGLVAIELSGIAAADSPRQTAETFRQSLHNRVSTNYPDATAAFPTGGLEDDKTSKVNLDGRTLPTARFNIEIKLPYKPKPEPTPASAPAKS